MDSFRLTFVVNQKDRETAEFNYWLLLSFAKKNTIEKSNDDNAVGPSTQTVQSKLTKCRPLN